jgi:Rrf2 family transcriptional regulator, cysteine metabolism repressor
MKITSKGNYALRAILDLSYKSQSNEFVPLVDICKRQSIPVKYLEQIMLALKKADFVDSKRGIGGGFFLKKKPDKLTIGEVIRQVDGPVDPTAGLKSENAISSNEDKQALQEVWMNVTRAISDIVDHVTFADLMCRAEELREKNADFNYMI